MSCDCQLIIKENDDDDDDDGLVVFFVQNIDHEALSFGNKNVL